MKSSARPRSDDIRRIFDRLASRYDIFNHLTSLGLDTYWRKEVLRPVKPGMRVLDLGCGTGDLAIEAARWVGPGGEVVGLDFSERMLAAARERSSRVRWVQGKAEDLPLEEEPFNLVVSGFVMRSLYQNIDDILLGVRRSLKNGGMIRFLDFTESPHGLFRAFWKFYMSSLVVLYGRMLFGKDYPASYLVDSAGWFVKPPEFVRKLEAAGFGNVKARFFLFKTIVLYEATL